MSENTAKILSRGLGIVQMPGRSYPGVVIQGDSLTLIFSKLMHSATALKKLGADDETLAITLEAVQNVGGMLVYYQEVCAEAGYVGTYQPLKDSQYLELIREYDRITNDDPPS
jgi:hypothetical protein